jgi:hypothetical protein
VRNSGRTGVVPDMATTSRTARPGRVTDATATRPCARRTRPRPSGGSACATSPASSSAPTTSSRRSGWTFPRTRVRQPRRARAGQQLGGVVGPVGPGHPPEPEAFEQFKPRLRRHRHRLREGLAARRAGEQPDRGSDREGSWPCPRTASTVTSKRRSTS